MPPRKRKNPNNENTSRQEKRSSQGSLTFLVLVMVILGIIVAILALKEPLAKMMIRSPGTSPEASAPGNTANGNQPTASPTPETPAQSASPLPEATKTPKPSPSPSPKMKDAITVDGGKTDPGTKTGKTIPTKTGAGTQGAAKTANQTGNKTQDLKTATVYMVRVDDSGNLGIESVKRKINFGDSPLINSMNAMLKGPSAAEMNDGLVSVIPQGTRLLSAWVNNGTAFLNFSENFMFNPLGSAGLQAQLKQVVFAASEFPTVEKVQILIEGKKTDYLGGDNVYVGKPLNRMSFRN